MANPISETPMLVGEDAENFLKNKAKVENAQNTQEKKEEKTRILANYDKVRSFSKVD